MEMFIAIFSGGIVGSVLTYFILKNTFVSRELIEIKEEMVRITHFISKTANSISSTVSNIVHKKKPGRPPKDPQAPL